MDSSNDSPLYLKSSTQEEKDKSLFFAIIKEGNTQKVKELIDNGANPNAIDEDDITPLHHAAYHNCIEITRLLLDKGANPNVLNEYGDSPLHNAAYYNYIEITRLLLDKGANPNVSNKDDNAPLHYATYNNRIEITRFLLDKGANPNILNKNGNSPLHHAAYHNCIEITRLLLDKGANPNILNKDDNAPLHHAASHNCIEITRFLLDKGANPNVLNKGGKPPLYNAASGNCLEIARFLLDKGADINIKNGDGIPPYIRFFEMLCIQSINNKLVYYFLALMSAEQIEEVLIIKPVFVNIVEDFKAKPSENFIEAVKDNCTILINYFIKAGARLDIVGEDNNTALHWAAYHGNIDLVKYLLQQNMDPALKGAASCTPLHFAAQEGHLKVAELLLNANKECLFSRDNHNDTPLHLACYFGYVELVAYLHKKGADKNCLNNRNETLLMIAHHNAKKEVVFYLVTAMSQEEIEHAEVAIPGFSKIFREEFKAEFSKHRDELFNIFKNSIAVKKSCEVFYPQGLEPEVLGKLMSLRFPAWFRHLVPMLTYKLFQVPFRLEQKNKYLPSFSAQSQDVEMQQEAKRKRVEDNEGPVPKRIKKDS